jgi:NAD-dependent deacetylase
MTTDPISEARELITNARSIAVLTGAGISTDSGVPDFRGPNGVWTLDPDAERLSDIVHYRKDPEVRHKSWDRYAANWGTYEPNAGHLALVRLHEDDRLLHVTTQNIDRLHHASGVPAERISELHGNREEVVCLGCGRVFLAHQVRFAWGDDMICSWCGGMLKPNVVYFGENLDPIVWTRSVSAASSCDLYLVIGTSLQVWPAADLPVYARDQGTSVIYVNGEPARDTRMKRLNCIGSISEILTQIIPE